MNNIFNGANRISSLVFIFLFLVCSCSDEDLEPDTVVQEIVEDEVSLEVNESDLMQNPYAISNMREAFSKVISEMNKESSTTNKGGFTSKEIDTVLTPNYIYVRFDPKNDIEEGRLMAYQDIVTIDYPFEYDNSEHYRREVPATVGKTNSYWASVPIDQKFPSNIAMTVLEEMYIPEKDPDYDGNDTSGKLTSRDRIDDKIDFMNHVVNTAFESTGNEDLIPPVADKSSSCETCFLGINFRDKWRPSGSLMIYDNTLARNIPMVGVNVLVRDTWTLDSQITGADGKFTFKELRAKVKYIIQWDRYEFSIRDNSGLTQAEDVSADKLYKEAWNKTITGGREKYRGEIFQAAYHYYYQNIGGLTKPPSNGFLKTQIKIAAVEKNEGPSSTKMAVGSDTFGVVPHIKIKQYGLTSERVYGTTIHELAHAAHYASASIWYGGIVKEAYIYNLGSDNPGPAGASARRFLESWATGVEIYLTQMHYIGLGLSGYKYRGENLQNIKSRGVDASRFYTTGIFDLTDTVNQRDAFGSDFPFDPVSGVSWSTLQSALAGSTNWESYRNKLITLYPTKERDINALFANWF